MKENGYTIERGFASGWDKDFAHPSQAWMLPKSQADEFAEHETWITMQTIMETVFFETEQQIFLHYLIGSLSGLSWKNVLLNARDTIRCYFKDKNLMENERTV